MSDLDKKYPLRLDTRIDFKNLIPHFYISDNETSDFYIKFTNDNQPVSVENVVIAIVVVNPNSQINSSLLDVNIDKGLIYCNLPNELKNVVGVYKAKIMCISEEERLVSNTFEYKVDMDEFAILNEVVEDSDEILLLTQMLSQINIISTEEGKRIENENIRLVNETERITNETNRINNEDERKSNELERITNETKRNNDENERQLKETERNESELNRESQELIRQNNELDRIAYDEVIENNENERHLKESERISNEESRANSENIRINNENNRERNEQIRQNNEENREFEFTTMNQSLNDLALGVNSVKNDILNNESNRISSEEDRKSNEELRINNEDVRITNEEARVKNEDTRLKSEEIRVSNEDTRERSENARKTNETTRVSNENKRITAESTRSSNENIRVNAENKRRNEHTARMEEIDEALANLPNSLPIANQTTLGGIKVGAGLSITADGILSATGGGGTADSIEWENVVGRPTKLSQFTNDSGFITSVPSEYITETELNAKGYLTEHQDLSGYAPLDSPNFTNSISMGRKEGTTVGKCSIALGGTMNNEGTLEASGNYSIATGFYSVAKGTYSHAEGFQTKATKNSSHSEGVMTTAESTGAHSEGGNTVARGYFSHSEGSETIASGEYQHVQGKYNIEDTENKYAHIVGNGASNTERSNAHTLDWNGNAWYKGKLSQEGSPTADNDLTTKRYVDTAISNMSISGGSGDGFNTISSNLILSLTASEIQNSIDSGTEITLSSLDGIFDENKRYIVEFLGERKLSSIYPTNNNEVIHWNISCNFGDSLVDLYYSTSDNVMKLGIVKKDTDTTITATDFKVYEETVVPFDAKYLPMNLTMQNSISMGRIGEIGNYSIALGFCTEASGYYSFSQGKKTTANGNYSHAEGYDTTASSNASHTEGIGTTASANASHAEGYGTKASNYYSHSEGCGTTASGIISHAEGFGTKAIGGYSHVEGSYTTASSSNQHVQGKYNIEDTENKYAHIVGNGTDDKARSNAHTLDWNGNGWYKGKLSQDGVPTEDKDLTTKRYVDGKVAEIVNSAPETLDTLNELATALGNDPNFATTVSTQIGNKVDKVTGKGLSTNDLTDALKSNYDTAYTHSQSAHFSGSYNDLTDKPTIPTSLPADGGNADTVGGYTIWTGTQTEYNALGTYSDTTIYMIKEG